ncbi:MULTISPECIES: class I SAM-dependent methyltransferase [Mammaliicoccus]|uniref:Methyltransferase domain-containing protein n=1 Tax=Mammaliicoccus lentus TaxID=42858 RepID=A0ABS6GUP9_MAMLE|nr:methyltransferase domain-containing protein [Mammaliicoccus lentus]MBU6113096.1 methyltransferase domain-containing protein [Mammaliicoccus lentus]MEB5685513.1 methyltransferase domain-containing protein [Mammaliicoccus lentus]
MNQKLTKKINNLETIQRIPVEDILPFISLNKVDKVLDLGAGVGYISLPISKYVDEVTAIDFDADILNYLDTKAKEKEITNIETLVSDFKDIQLSSETFDRAIASISLHEVSPLSQALNEIYRVLKNKGVFLCIELEKLDLTKAPRVSSEDMIEQVRDAGFDKVDVFYPEGKIANQPVYIVVAEKNI